MSFQTRNKFLIYFNVHFTIQLTKFGQSLYSTGIPTVKYCILQQVAT
jgi:hypothetical protein